MKEILLAVEIRDATLNESSNTTNCEGIITKLRRKTAATARACLPRN